MVIGYARLLALLLLPIWAPRSSAQAVPRVGEAAPPLTVTHLLQAPDGSSLTWDALRGQSVVLEFWATWCGGCVANIPHINELAKKFSGQPVLFISLTDEERPTVLRFLNTHPISGWVALDPKRSTFDAYKVQGIPQTFLIDANGKLRAITQPNNVNNRVIEDLLAGRTLDTPGFDRAAGAPLLGTEPGAPAPLVQLLVRPAASVQVSKFSPGARALINGRYEAFGVTLRDILGEAYNFPISRIDAPDWCSQVKYDLSVAVPHGGGAERGPLLQQMLAIVFHLRVHPEMRDTSIYILGTVPGRKPNLKASMDGGVTSRPWGGTGEFQAVGAPLKALVHIASSELNSEVIDETGMKDRYDFHLKWDPKNPDSMVSAIREQLSLELVRSQRNLEHIVVESAEEPKTW